MTKTRRSSLQLVKPCDRCKTWPCVCDYIRKIRTDGPLAHLRPAAIENYDLPLPHRMGCPCPRCYAIRLRTWEPESDEVEEAL